MIEMVEGAKTLRDEFAMAALQGLLACPDPGPLAESAAQFRAYVARLSYEYADAMLKARAQ